MDSPKPGGSQMEEETTRKVDDPPFDPECEVFEEGGPDAKHCFDFCSKNPGHIGYIPVHSFSMSDIPQGCQSEKFLRAIKECCDRTVKMSVKYTSPNRPNTYPNSTSPYPESELKGSRRVVRCGTGVVYFVRPSTIKGKPCPCHLCKKSGKPKMEFAKVEVFTAAHVVFDDYEAECTVCELFYDSEDRDNVKCLYGVKGVENGSGDCADCEGEAGINEKCKGDKFFIQCVTHDIELFEVLKSKMSGIYSQFYGTFPLKFIVSHPHGLSKHIAFGKVLHYSIVMPQDYVSKSEYTIPALTSYRLTSTLQNEPIFSQYFSNDRYSRTLQDLKLSVPLCTSGELQLEIFDDKIDWVQFPNSWELTSKNQRESMPTKGFRFYLPQLVDIFKGKFVSYFMTYDIATCRGSSGAQVVADNNELKELDWVAHFGSLSNGSNRSGINKHHILPHGDPGWGRHF